MKKYIVLTVLFILPIVAYLFFATASHNSLFLPVLKKYNSDITFKCNSLNDEKVQLKSKITILGFPGSDLASAKPNIFNLNQKIYNKYAGFKDLQMVMILPKGKETEIKAMLKEFERLSKDLTYWHFVFADENDIKSYFSSFGFKNNLDKNCGTPLVYLLDKDIALRGRKDMEYKGKKEYRESYNTISAAELHNEMGDDVRILLREYRLALKKNNKRKDEFRDKISNQVEQQKNEK